MEINIFWFRRDLRLHDNTALSHALKDGLPVLPVFIFDKNILNGLPGDDPRVFFIYTSLESIHSELKKHGKGLKIFQGDPVEIWKAIIHSYTIKKVFWNKDYEPNALIRDRKVKTILENKNIQTLTYKDQVIFEEGDVVKPDGSPYTVFTPYKNKWIEKFRAETMQPPSPVNFGMFLPDEAPFPALADLGFVRSPIRVKDVNLSVLNDYQILRDVPWKEATSGLGPHLRFGTVSIRQIIRKLTADHISFLNELIWREFFMQILYHFPKVVTSNFHTKYDDVPWRNAPEEFELWCQGKTGYPLVDAGMRQLNETGYMHGRARMIAAGFLCKHLLIHWTHGEAWFAKKLLDYELASNNGNWQWAAGTGCDAAPYFRIFNPVTQQKKFDRNLTYIKRWIPEYGTDSYPQPIVGHQEARDRALKAFSILRKK